jgi:hypothetical protein
MQDAWFCSSSCLEYEARAIFDHVGSVQNSPLAPNHRVPLGLLDAGSGLHK